MPAVRVFFSSAKFAYFALFSWLNPPMWLTMKFVLPLGQMSFFAFVANYVAVQKGIAAAPLVAYMALGNALQGVSWSAVFSLSNTTGQEKWEGTLSYLLVAPANRLSLFVGRSLLYIADGLVTTSVGLLFAVFLYGATLPSSSVGWVALIVVVTSVAMSGFGLMLAGLAFYMRNSLVIANIFTFITLILCGVNFPVSDLPLWVQPVSYAIPLTYGQNAIHALAEPALDAGYIAGNLVLEAAAGVILALAGYLMFRYFERKAREKGLLEEA